MHRFLKAAVVGVSGVALTLTVTLAAELPADAASSCNATFKSYHKVAKGSHGTQTRAAQCLLKAAGYSAKVDGSFSSHDSAELTKFQKSHHVRPSGTVYLSSWTALLSRGSKPTLKYGKDGASVKRLQRSLTATGRYVNATGHFGPITENAVKSLQRMQGLKVTGKADSAVWRTLQYGDGIVKKTAVAKPAAPKPAPAPVSSSSSKGQKVVAYAKKQVGDRYKWGAAGPSSWDCSGLTMKAWGSVGVGLPHQAKQQFKKGAHIKKANLRPGDLVFYYSGIKHVGVYIGGGRIIDAANPKKGVRYTSVNSMPYQGARRY